jgi:hypothetical protein
MLRLDEKTPVAAWQFNTLKQSAKDFETVLANELTGLPIYYVSPKGIFSIDDLIYHADSHLPQAVFTALPEKAHRDICDSGRCLAFEIPTASAFHMWRALETVMDTYYEALTGQTFEQARVVRNWGKYIEALEAAGAEERITKFLDHIRAEYRNPISHPTDTLEPDEAFSLFGAGLSAITQAMKETIRLAPVQEENVRGIDQILANLYSAPEAPSLPPLTAEDTPAVQAAESGTSGVEPAEGENPS